MSIKISKRKLRVDEIDLLISEIRKFPNPVAGSEKRWQRFNLVYIMTENNNLVGICAVIKLKNWVKLGPFVVLAKYQGRGYGKSIIESIVSDYPHNNLFVGSRNPKVGKIATSLGFEEVSNIWLLPNEIKFYLLQNLFDNLSFDFIRELIRKKPTREGKYRCFLKLKEKVN